MADAAPGLTIDKHGVTGYNTQASFRGRSTAGPQFLELLIGVRIPAPEPLFSFFANRSAPSAAVLYFKAGWVQSIREGKTI